MTARSAATQTLAANLRQRRAALGLDMRGLGELCGLSASSIWSAERGKGLSMETVQRLARGLGCTAAELMDEPACPFCRDVPLPGWACGTCGRGTLPPASLMPVPAGLIEDLAVLVGTGQAEAVTDERGVLRIRPVPDGGPEATS